MSHSYEEMQGVARDIPGVDVIIGSHIGPEGSNYLPEPEVVNAAALSIAGDNVRGLGQLALTVSDGRVVSHTFQRHVPSPNGPADPEIDSILDGYRRARMTVRDGTASSDPGG